jgi:hypothetical protein
VQQPTKFELVINLTTAKTLGLINTQVIPAARGSGDQLTTFFAALR